MARRKIIDGGERAPRRLSGAPEAAGREQPPPPEVREPTEAEIRVAASLNSALQDAEPRLSIPSDWNLGALLNVRNNGEYYVTLYPEEYDHRHPERALRFPNPAECQNFVSSWYARTYHDGRA